MNTGEFKNVVKGFQFAHYLLAKFEFYPVKMTLSNRYGKPL